MNICTSMSAKNHAFFNKIIEFGQKADADVAMFMDGEFWQYYKKGGSKNKNYWLNMPIAKGAKREWRNSYNSSLEQLKQFYENLGHVVELIPVPKTGNK